MTFNAYICFALQSRLVNVEVADWNTYDVSNRMTVDLDSSHFDLQCAVKYRESNEKRDVDHGESD